MNQHSAKSHNYNVLFTLSLFSLVCFFLRRTFGDHTLVLGILMLFAAAILAIIVLSDYSNDSRHPADPRREIDWSIILIASWLIVFGCFLII